MRDLPDSKTPPDPPALPPKRRWMRCLLLVPVLVFVAALWLNGPGLRFLAPRIVDRYMREAGLDGEFKVEGRLTSGLAFSDLRIVGDGALESLTVDRVIPSYSLRGLLGGEVEGLVLEGVHADLRLDGEKEDSEKSPLDLERITRTLRNVRGQMLPLDLEVKDITVNATRDGKPAIILAKSRITHVAGSSDFTLQFGKLSDGEGREWAAQDIDVQWQPESLSIANMMPVPGVTLRDFLLQLPADGQMSLESHVEIGAAIFMLTTSPGLSSAKIDLIEGQMNLGETAAAFGFELPASATLTSLALEMDDILPDPKAASGTARILLENITWEDWTARELGLDATLTDSEASIAARGAALGTEISLDATAPVTRGEESFTLGEAKGRFNVVDVPRLLRELSARVPAIHGEALLPAAKLDGGFTIGFGNNNAPQLVQVDAALKAADPELASDLAVKSSWAPGEPIQAEMTLDGLMASGIYQFEPQIYQAEAKFDEFTSTRIERWLDVVGIDLGGTVNLSGEWSGSGDLDEGVHRGDLSQVQASWAREEMPVITAIGGVKYDWPGAIETRGLRVRMAEQTVVLDAELANNTIDVRDFVWSSAEQELATGTASLPVPQDFAKWRETLAEDERPISVFLNSRELSLGLLGPWVPALEQLDPNSTGQVQINITGTYADPVVEAQLDARSLRSPAQPELPPTDIRIGLVGRDGRLTIEGRATAPDFPAAQMNASMAFRPAAWAEDSELLKSEAIEGRIQLPRLDISRFTSLFPAAKQLSGVVTGDVIIAGTLGEPDLRGALDLAGGGIQFRSPRIPNIDSLDGTLDLARDRLVLRKLRSNIAGGTLVGEGSVVITEGALGEIDVRLRGDHLPVLRNDQFIIRANADLRLQGTLEQAALTGTIGTVDSLFHRDIEILPMSTPFTTPAAAELPRLDARSQPEEFVPEAIRNWTLDVQLSTLEPFLLRGNVANGYITGRGRIGGTFGDPAPDGQIRVHDFQASLPFSTLSIRSGTATFTPKTGFDPILELRGSAEPRPYRVNVFIFGRASDPQHILTSNPPLPENEIMTLLATGTTTEGLENPQAAASRALQLLLEEVRRGRFRFGRQLRPLLRLLDRVDFTLAEEDPFTTEAYSTATLSITDRWFISAGVGETGDSRFLAIWRYSFR